ncbi:GNAT family N-acetyltransferase [uncultured Tateyamaria sp.]|uniref:GNAT family N-acetyltransferase n=1 Tax=uncultured Tateyamaria sp. TaxID=455651 RepID=UPI00261CDAA4|nr:GNAT family N-acetyltransferase [uncultured Tateyamaria sp.]
MTAPHALPKVRNDPALVRQFVEIFEEHGATRLIADLHTTVSLIKVGGHSFPVTVNDAGETPNSYLCSPTRAYIDYAIDETRNFAAQPVLQRCIKTLIQTCAPLVRAAGLDRQVQLNNWLFSTNPVPDISPVHATEIRDTLTATYPDRAIVIRSLNEMADASTIDALRAAGFVMMPSRQIYVVRDKVALSKEMKADRSKLARAPFTTVGNDDFVEADYARCAALYNMLYLEKYTPLNPHYTPLYVQQMHQRGILRLVGLRNTNGVLVAITGLFENGRTLTQPLVGYDTSLPRQDALYRMIMAMGQDEAFTRGLFFNMSAGAAHFKRLRGAQPVIEYSAVYVGTLPWHQRVTTRIIAYLLRAIGIPLLKKYEL